MAAIVTPALMPERRRPRGGDGRRRHDVGDALLWRLFAVERRSLKQVGEIVGLTPSGVSRRLTRAFPNAYPPLAATRHTPRGPQGARRPNPGKPGVRRVWRLFAGNGLNVWQVAQVTGLSCGAVLLRPRLRLRPGYRAELERRAADASTHRLTRRWAKAELKRLMEGKQ